MTLATINIIAAMSEDNAIGRDGNLPWRIPEDLARFKAITMGHPVVMGRKTYDSLGKPLPGRDNIVVSRKTPNYIAMTPGVSVTRNLDRAIKWAQERKGVKEVFIIGGAEIYKLALPFTDRLYITTILGTTLGADTFFPEVDYDDWECVSRKKDLEKDGYCFEVWEKPL